MLRLRSINRLVGTVSVTVGVLAASVGSAQAAFPDFSDCPRASVDSCVHVQATSGNMVIKGFNVPLGDSLQIRGGLRFDTGGTFVAPRGTTGVFARSVPVPGGLLGIDLPFGFDDVYATPELAGAPSAIRINPLGATVSLPLKLRLSNPFIGPNCHIGSNSNPVNLTLIPGTTNPPPPNRPISGRLGRLTVGPGGTSVLLIGNTNVDNSFSIPGASSCGLGLGLINELINLKLGLPSASGNNTIISNNDVAIQAAN